MSSLAIARDMHVQAQGNKRQRMKLRAVEGKRQPNEKGFDLGEAALKLPGMNGFGVERPFGLKQKRVLAEEKPERDDGPEQGRMYKNPNWWQHERMMM